MLYFLLSLLASPLLYTLMAGRRRKHIQRILVIQTAKIGDLVCATPVFREIRRKYPQAYLVAAINPVALGILEHNPHVDEIIPIKSGDCKGLWGKIKLAGIFRAKRFDVALSLLPNLPNTLIPFWALVPRRISIYPDRAGLTFKCCSLFNSHLQQHQRGELVSQTYLKALKFLAIDNPDHSPEVFASGEAKQAVEAFCKQEGIDDDSLLIGISVSCGNKLKEWGQDKFAALADLILEDYPAQIVFIGAETDKQAATEIQTLMKLKTINSCGKFSLAELPALLKRFKLFIGVDTGTIYMAVAAGIPVINIAGPCDMRERPLGEKSEIVQKAFTCVPCSYTYSTRNFCRSGDRKCITAITPEEVMKAVDKQLGGNSQHLRNG